MKIYIIRKRQGVTATADFDPVSKTVTVLKNSVLSKDVRHTEKFCGANTIKKSVAVL